MGQPTRVDVALLAGQAFDPATNVCVIVDVLRASSSIVTLLERGCESVVAAANVAQARQLKERLPDHLLCGEEAGLPPDGFDYGNSPAEFSRLALTGKHAILATSNGTRVLAAAGQSSPVVVVGCLLNRTAAARAAVNIARERGLRVAIVSSAEHGGGTFVLEDALGAGAIAESALRLPDTVPGDAARFAADAFSHASSDIEAAVRSAYHSQELIDAGLGKDVAYCARVDVSHVTPILTPGEDGTLRLRG
ncbi:MAG TPA: 2-phosphosulfolactate phosphatase [Dehalococcoidia bacterium]|nr:2-phosphosulfolactate phosphatase [Dehalococcoidia bacterium]